MANADWHHIRLTVEQFYIGDILILQGESEPLQPLFEDPSLLEPGESEAITDWDRSADVRVMEVVVMPNSIIMTYFCCRVSPVHLHSCATISDALLLKTAGRKSHQSAAHC